MVGKFVFAVPLCKFIPVRFVVSQRFWLFINLDHAILNYTSYLNFIILTMPVFKSFFFLILTLAENLYQVDRLILLGSINFQQDFQNFVFYFWTQWCWRFTPLHNDSLSLYACIIYVYHWRRVILYDCWLFNVRRQIFDAYPELENKCNSV